ncbi:hypothetical protein ACF07K_33060, partial [Streptomyces sp. NPDC015350]
MAERVRVRDNDDDEGRRLLRIVRRGTGSVVTWRRSQMVLLSAQGMPVAKIAEVTFTSADRVRDVIHKGPVPEWWTPLSPAPAGAGQEASFMVMKVYSPEFKADAVALYLSDPSHTFE